LILIVTLILIAVTLIAAVIAAVKVAAAEVATAIVAHPIAEIRIAKITTVRHKSTSYYALKNPLVPADNQSGNPLKEGRRHRRMPYAGPIRISWDEPSGPRYAIGKCIELSESGARVEVPVNIPVRTSIRLNAERIKLAGSASVRHVARHGAKYILGLELSQSMTEKVAVAIREPWALRSETPVG
jgi:hypothetical protein